MTVFNEKINRFNTASVKWERTKEIFGAEDVLPMWVADMDFRPPQAVIDRIKDRAEHGVFGYTFVPDSAAEAILGWVSKRHNWNIKPEFLLYSSGVVASMSTAIQAFTEPGEKVLLTSPVYTPFFDMIKLNRRTAVNSPLHIKNGQFEIDFDLFEQELKSGCKLFLLCNPHNPGGRVWRKEELEKIGDLCLQYNCLIVSDEIHSDIVYKPFKHVPIASLSPELSQQTVTFIAPSKTFNLAGLQASAVIIENSELRNKFHAVQIRQGHFSLNTFGVIGMEAAYRDGEEWLNGLLDYLQKNKQIAIDYLSEHLPMISFMDPEGTYLLWLDCNKLNFTDAELLKTLTHKGKVALEPGKKFGPGGEGFLRLNFGCPKNVLEDGLQRIKTALNG